MRIVTLRLMTQYDLPMLQDGLHRPHIVERWGGQDERLTLEGVQSLSAKASGTQTNHCLHRDVG